MIEAVRRRSRPLWLFGAGHVGRALAKVLAELPFEVTWLDSRFDGFPEQIPAGVGHVVAPRLAEAVENAPAGTLFLVLTHSHQLDLDICDRVLRRGDFAFLGLIGSATKKARFLSALKGRGHGAGGAGAAGLPDRPCPNSGQAAYGDSSRDRGAVAGAAGGAGKQRGKRTIHREATRGRVTPGDHAR